MNIVKNQAGGDCEVLDERISELSPIITVYVLAYNHEDFIAHALESILEQETKFTYEIIVSDDCSTDSTPEIIREYKKRYPDKICAFLHKENQGVSGNGRFIQQYLRGKYIASLEGDDFWNYSGKLEAQVQFLEENPRFIGTAHKTNVCDIDEIPLHIEEEFKRKEGEVTFKDALKYRLCFHTSSVIRRNIEYKKPEQLSRVYAAHKYVGDQVQRLVLTSIGPFYLFPGYWSTYRLIISPTRQNAHSWGTKNRVRSAVQLIEQTRLLQDYLGKEFNLDPRIAYNVFVLYYSMLRDRNKTSPEDMQDARTILETIPFRLKFRAVMHGVASSYKLFRKRK